MSRTKADEDVGVVRKPILLMRLLDLYYDGIDFRLWIIVNGGFALVD